MFSEKYLFNNNDIQPYQIAVIENNKVINVVVADQEFAEQNGWIDADNAELEWSYINGMFTAPQDEGQQIQAQNKATASQLLTESDWTTQSSVADPAVSNPHLTNQAAFLAYRSQVRAIAVNPPTTPEIGRAHV